MTQSKDRRFGDPLGLAASTGLPVMIIIISNGHSSDAHLNPSVTIFTNDENAKLWKKTSPGLDTKGTGHTNDQSPEKMGLSPEKATWVGQGGESPPDFNKVGKRYLIFLHFYLNLIKLYFLRIFLSFNGGYFRKLNYGLELRSLGSWK